MTKQDTVKTFRPNRNSDGRLVQSTFDLTRAVSDVTDRYFESTQEVLLNEKMYDTATMQVFQKKGGVVCGLDEVIALIAEHAGVHDPVTHSWIPGLGELTIHALRDGDIVEPGEVVMTIRGPYCLFAMLETVYLGKLARQTNIATNVKHLVDVAGEKPIYFFGARFDDPEVQPGDGYAAMIGGAAGVSTEAQAVYFHGEPMGTIPHALIAMFRGDTVAAAKAYHRRYPERKLSVLVDYHNDCVGTSLAVARELGKDLHGVRLDTSEKMVDKRVQQYLTTKSMAGWDLGDDEEASKHRGVSGLLVRLVREALDKEGFHHVKIMVSGGFNEGKIALFNGMGVPVDSYGVGASLLEGAINFTADIVEVNDEPEAKVGRKLLPNPRLLPVDLSDYVASEVW